MTTEWNQGQWGDLGREGDANSQESLHQGVRTSSWEYVAANRSLGIKKDSPQNWDTQRITRTLREEKVTETRDSRERDTQKSRCRMHIEVLQ